MINYDPDYIDKLNAQYESGKWIKAAIVTETVSPPVKRYFADHETPIQFDGNTYEPLSMRWDNIKTSQSMPTDGAEVALSNITGQVTAYIKEFDITGNQIVIQLLHLDLLSTLTSSDKYRRQFKVLGVRYDNLAAIVTVGRNLGRNRLPRGIILADEFPGISADVPRIL